MCCTQARGINADFACEHVGKSVQRNVAVLRYHFVQLIIIASLPGLPVIDVLIPELQLKEI